MLEISAPWLWHRAISQEDEWKPENENVSAFIEKYGQPKEAKEDWSKKKNLTQQEIGLTLKERWNIQPPLNCQGCHR